uniref:NAD(P)H-quinone oxidoreductase subunit K, chloroplastic n=1 Tax=Lygodium microphyllum TaxID=148566 RepID=A0A345HHJ2_9MONI|nr:NADH-plastoquinone oxidoreductase subunit K [Lygodium microphyllum]AXG76082.1 NADH-plastoquinone oxidoreductase subunit K [Lygodium microphyllum]
MVSISKFLSDNRQINSRENQLINSIESFFPEAYPSNSIFLANLNDFSNWSRLSSLWPLLYGTSCCFIEFASLIGSRFDFDRYGLVPRSSPRQADLLITAGTITMKMAPSLVRLYEQMPEPKYVIAMGACTISGGMFSTDSYTTVRGVDKLIPVDIYLPGCPPKPEAIFDAVTKLRKKMAGETNKDRIDRSSRRKYFTLTHKFVVPNIDISSYDYRMYDSSPKFLTDISLETFLEVVKDKSEGSVSGTDI